MVTLKLLACLLQSDFAVISQLIQGILRFFTESANF